MNNSIWSNMPQCPYVHAYSSNAAEDMERTFLGFASWTKYPGGASDYTMMYNYGDYTDRYKTNM